MFLIIIRRKTFKQQTVQKRYIHIDSFWYENCRFVCVSLLELVIQDIYDNQFTLQTLQKGELE